MTTYIKSFSVDFGNSFESSQFSQEIKSNTGITKTLLNITRDGDTISIDFNEALPAGEQTILNNLVSNHTPSAESKYNFIHTAYARKDLYNNTSYRDISTYVYPGSNKIGTIKQIVCVTYMDSGVTDYSIRIYDDTNNNIMGEETFTNTARQSLEILPINNIPTSSAVITVQIKKNGGNNQKYVYIENIQFRI